MKPFTHLHIHSNYSLCQGANSIEEICKATRQLGMDSLAITDTNGIYGLVWFIQTAKEYGLRPIIGAEVKTDDNRGVILAKNIKGYATLCRILTVRHCEENFDLARYLAQQHSEIIVLCASVDLLAQFKKAGCDVYAEIIPHANREKILNYSRQAGIPPVASGDVYFVNRDDREIHQLLRAIDLNTTMSRLPEKEVASPDAYLRSAEEMAAFFPDCPQAMENAYKIARQCTFELDFGQLIFASFTGPKGEDAYTYLEQEALKGVIWRYGEITPAVKKRLDYELAIIAEKGFAPYFLVMADIVRHAPRTCGRGSAAASLVSYCLGITHVDPIRYDLFFDRFLNPGREDPPDIDVDFPWDERDDILNYIFQKYGSECTAMIANHNGFRARAAAREVAKVFGLPDAEISAVTKKLSAYWAAGGLSDLVNKHPVFRNVELEHPWPKILHLAEKLHGFPRHLSVHCGGVVIAPDGLSNYVPLQPAKKKLKPTGIIQSGSNESAIKLPKQIRVVQWEKDQSEEMGLVKMDILGNRSLAVIRDALGAVKQNYGIDIDYAKWNPLDDEKTINIIARGETIGVFYVESPAMRLLQQKTGVGDYEHLVIHSSIIRPAANAYINEYIRRLKGGEYQPLHPLLEEILQETFGIMVYQEDVSKVAIALAGFDSAEADVLRKIISKKHKQKQLQDYRKKFYQGAKNRGVDGETCDKIWDMIISFSGYSFCKPHSASFALVSFKSAYLRAHYPAEFMAAVISNQGGYYSAFAYISEARRMGLKILLPDINHSEKHYTGFKNEIQIGLMQLKGISAKAIDLLIQERENRGRFASFLDFINRVPIDASDVRVLIKAGAFDELEKNCTRPELMWRLRWWIAERRHLKVDKSPSLFDNSEMNPPNLPNAQKYDEQKILRDEIETLGFLISKHPLTLYKDRIRKLKYVPGKDLKKHVNQNVLTIGWLITRKPAQTKTGEMMEFMSFEDTTAIYETTFFPRTYTKFVHMMTFTRPYVLYSRVESHYGAVTLNVNKVEWL